MSFALSNFGSHIVKKKPLPPTASPRAVFARSTLNPRVGLSLVTLPKASLLERHYTIKHKTGQRSIWDVIFGTGRF